MTTDAPETPDPEIPEAEGFAALGLSPELLAAVEAEGFSEPTPIQVAAIPPLLDGRDLIGLARTGTGKTAAFALPLLQRIDRRRREVQALVLAPTRELALQVSKACSAFGKSLGGLGVATVYGGQPYGGQIKALKRGAALVVGTPGRILDLLNRGALRLDGLDCIVLDEADEMLRMGFVEDIEMILAHTPDDRPRQTMLFSATMSKQVRAVAAKHLSDPVDLEVRGGEEPVPEIEQQILIVREADRIDVLDRLLEVESDGASLVFTRTRLAAAQVAERLERRGHPAAALHGEMSQSLRETVLGRFRSGLARVLVATDVAARGLDVEGITLVVNLDPPLDRDGYVHRIGRTGRAGRKGTAVTFAGPGDKQFILGVQSYAKDALTRRRPPGVAEVMAGRAERLRARITEGKDEGLEPYLAQVDVLVEGGMDPKEAAARALRLACGARPLSDPASAPPDVVHVPFWLPLGRRDRVRVGDIVGALCGDLGLSRDNIGAVDLADRHTEVWIDEAWADRVAKAGQIQLRSRVTRIVRADGLGKTRGFGRGKPQARSPHQFRKSPKGKGPYKKGGQKRPWKQRRP